MISSIIASIIWYVSFIAIMWYSTTLDKNWGTIIFWFSFILSSFSLFQVYKLTREYFIIIFAKCHEIDQDYIDEEIKAYNKDLNSDS